MVSSRQRSSAAAATATAETSSHATNTPPSSANSRSSKVQKVPLEEWTTKEKLCLASLAIKHNNAWNSVARNMQSFIEKDRPEGWSNQKTCAAQFDKLMNEFRVDKRPKRNEPSEGNSSSVIYKKMSEKRCKELQDSIKELREKWLDSKKTLDELGGGDSNTIENSKQKATTIATTTTTPASPKHTTRSSTASESEKPPTRALTRRESSRQNLEKTLVVLCKEAAEIKNLNLLTKPAQESDREIYDKVILKHMDMSIIRKLYGAGHEVEDPYAVMNDLMLMFQNATMFYSTDHHIYKIAVELRDKMVPQWEKALLDRFKSSRH